MKNHTKVYMKHFGLSEGDYIYSEISGQPAIDVHHLNARKIGGSKTKDYIENLIALTREEHMLCENNPRINEIAKEIHRHYLVNNPYKKPEIDFNPIFRLNIQKINKLI